MGNDNHSTASKLIASEGAGFNSPLGRAPCETCAYMQEDCMSTNATLIENPSTFEFAIITGRRYDNVSCYPAVAEFNTGTKESESGSLKSLGFTQWTAGAIGESKQVFIIE